MDMPTTTYTHQPALGSSLETITTVDGCRFPLSIVNSLVWGEDDPRVVAIFTDGSRLRVTTPDQGVTLENVIHSINLFGSFDASEAVGA